MRVVGIYYPDGIMNLSYQCIDEQEFDTITQARDTFSHFSEHDHRASERVELLLYRIDHDLGVRTAHSVLFVRPCGGVRRRAPSIDEINVLGSI